MEEKFVLPINFQLYVINEEGEWEGPTSLNAAPVFINASKGTDIYDTHWKFATTGMVSPFKDLVPKKGMPSGVTESALAKHENFESITVTVYGKSGVTMKVLVDAAVVAAEFVRGWFRDAHYPASNAPVDEPASDTSHWYDSVSSIEAIADEDPSYKDL